MSVKWTVTVPPDPLYYRVVVEDQAMYELVAKESDTRSVVLGGGLTATPDDDPAFNPVLTLQTNLNL